MHELFGQGGRRMNDRLLPDGWVAMLESSSAVPENRRLSGGSSGGQRQEPLQEQERLKQQRTVRDLDMNSDFPDFPS